MPPTGLSQSNQGARCSAIAAQSASRRARYRATTPGWIRSTSPARSARNAMPWVRPLVHMSLPCLAFAMARIIAGAAITQPIRSPGTISLDNVPM